MFFFSDCTNNQLSKRFVYEIVQIHCVLHVKKPFLWWIFKKHDYLFKVIQEHLWTLFFYRLTGISTYKFTFLRPLVSASNKNTPVHSIWDVC